MADSIPVPAIRTLSLAAASRADFSTSRRSSSLSRMASPVEPCTTMPAIGVARVLLDVLLQLAEVDLAVRIERRGDGRKDSV